jgi:ERCC4-type nuclease
MLRRSYTVAIDTREQKPVPFPDWLPILRTPLCGDTTTVRIVTVPVTLDAGDYALTDHPAGAGVERKYKLREIAKNCLTEDRHRMRSALERLADVYSHPYLLVEDTVRGLLGDRKIEKPYRAYDALLRLLTEFHITLIHAEGRSARQRALTGEVIARILINAAIGEDR